MFVRRNGVLTLLSAFRTSPNIGLIKYWGKWHPEEIIPVNTNIGITLNANHIYTKTTLTLNPLTTGVQLSLNGNPFPVSSRIQRLFTLARDHLSELKSAPSHSFANSPDPQKTVGELMPDLGKCGFEIESTNSFPTGSGLASSSSGLSALALCLADIFKSLDARYMSRIGSGSACRCLYGGLVVFPGVALEHLDSAQSQAIVKAESERCLPYKLANDDWFRKTCQVAILTDGYLGQKEVLSKDGMQRTIETSALLQHRIRVGVQKHVSLFEQAVNEKNFNGLMEVIMRDSNQFHATCMDSYPPLLYLNDFSRRVISMVHSFNKQSKSHVGYTFDAGAHAVLLMEQETKESFRAYISEKVGDRTQQIWTSVGDGPQVQYPSV